MNVKKLQTSLELFWDKEIVPTLIDYIKIPNKSPAFDPLWEESGHMNMALNMAKDWINTHKPPGSTIYIKKDEGRTPLLLLEIPGEREGSVLMYGHLDKQPEMEGWRKGFGPWTPVIEGEKLYGRGGADDGYALFASLGAIKALKEQNENLPRIVILIEFCEESGSPDLPYYIDKYEDIIGKVDLVFCLDSGAGNYDQFWTTVSLRGLVGCTLRVDVLKEGVHSGAASGLVPSSFRIIKQLISRVENENTGEITLKELHVKIPDRRIAEAKKMVNTLGEKTESMPWVQGMCPSTDDSLDGTLRRTWKPALSVVGMDGIPAIKDGGNVLRPYTALKLSMRIPPGLDSLKAQEALKTALIKDPPYNAKITIDFEEPASGWNAPGLAKWLEDAIQDASKTVFDKPALAMGEGGTIPFMSMLGKKYPKAQFVITGVLGPESNAHGPNEFLHIAFAKKLSVCIGIILTKFQK